MTRTRLYISFLKPLLTLLDPDLEDFITRWGVCSVRVCTCVCIACVHLSLCRSQCYYFFSLSWLITWFGHVIQDNGLVMRLADVFLASHPLMPLYLAAMVMSVGSIMGPRASVLYSGLVNQPPCYGDQLSYLCRNDIINYFLSK